MRKLLLACPLLVGCSSASFSTQSVDSTTTTGDAASSIEVANDSGGDGAVLTSCPSPDPDKAQFCFTITAGSHPPYNYAGSDAKGSFTLDGSGVLTLALYSANGAPDFGVALSGTATAAWSNPYPVSPLNIDAGPYTMAGSVDPGTYWVVAKFADIGGGGGLRIGDFIDPPLILSTTYTAEFPMVTLTAGQVVTSMDLPTQNADSGVVSTVPTDHLELDPLRRNTVTIKPWVNAPASADGTGPILLAQFTTFTTYTAVPSA